jgi:uncharacterized protein (TIGR00369 family)
VPAPNADRFAPLAPARTRRWADFPNWPDRTYFPKVVGIVLEEVRTDYARMRLPWRPELAQPAGVMHGGAIATLIDTVVVPAVGSAFDEVPRMMTLNLSVNYQSAIPEGEDAVAEGWVERRGRSIVFLRVEVMAATSGDIAATGNLVYKVTPPR